VTTPAHSFHTAASSKVFALPELPVSTMLMSWIAAFQDNADTVFQAKHQRSSFYFKEGLPGLAAVQCESQAQQCHCAAAKACCHASMLPKLCQYLPCDAIAGRFTF